jgi:hypothetical protein
MGPEAAMIRCTGDTRTIRQAQICSRLPAYRLHRALAAGPEGKVEGGREQSRCAGMIGHSGGSATATRRAGRGQRRWVPFVRRPGLGRGSWSGQDAASQGRAGARVGCA